MAINPLIGGYTSLDAVADRLGLTTADKPDTQEIGQPTFLDVFTDIIKDAAETQEQKNQDVMDIMLGDTDNLEEIQANVAKAEIALDLLVTVKNSVVEAYNEIIKMSI